MKNLLKHTKLLALVGSTLLLSSCATIMSKHIYDVKIDSNPSHLHFSVLDLKTNTVISNGTTPQVVTLNSSVGFFDKALYKIAVTKRNGQKVYYILNADIDGWYFANLAFGGVLGMLVIDPATGAMWKLPESIVIEANNTANITDNKSIKLAFVDINNLTDAQKSKLIAIKPSL